MDLEREKGITIKSHAIQMEYTARDGQRYTLNLIDTPGHVDFSYEVSRAIASCEGALLVVDATQGIQAQTISNLYLAVGHDLEIIPVLNKIDMDSAMIDEVKDQVIDLIGCREEDILLASGKTGLGVEEVLEAIVNRIPAPTGDESAPLQALIFDSVFNPFRGIIAYFRVFNGTLRKGDHVKFFNTGSEYDADEIGVLKLKMQPRQEIRAGDVGYICSGIKTSSDVKVGDTIGSLMPSPAPKPCASVVLQAPSGPDSSSTSPPRTIPARRSPMFRMAASFGASRVIALSCTPVPLRMLTVAPFLCSRCIRCCAQAHRRDRHHWFCFARRPMPAFGHTWIARRTSIHRAVHA